MKVINFKTRFDKPEKVLQANTKPSKTKQSFANACDINKIVAKAQKTGELPNLIKKNPQYGDFSEVPEYQEALNIVIKAELQFEALPSHVRDRFANDPSNFLAFATNEANREEMDKLGLLKPKEIDLKPVQPMPLPKDVAKA